jgi:hypothetical protein
MKVKGLGMNVNAQMVHTWKRHDHNGPALAPFHGTACNSHPVVTRVFSDKCEKWMWPQHMMLFFGVEQQPFDVGTERSYGVVSTFITKSRTFWWLFTVKSVWNSKFKTLTIWLGHQGEETQSHGDIRLKKLVLKLTVNQSHRGK